MTQPLPSPALQAAMAWAQGASDAFRDAMANCPPEAHLTVHLDGGEIVLNRAEEVRREGFWSTTDTEIRLTLPARLRDHA